MSYSGEAMLHIFKIIKGRTFKFYKICKTAHSNLFSYDTMTSYDVVSDDRH